MRTKCFLGVLACGFVLLVPGCGKEEPLSVPESQAPGTAVSGQVGSTSAGGAQPQGTKPATDQ